MDPVTVAPGNNEVTWGYITSGYGGDGAEGFAPAVSVANLAAKFPNGYVVQTIAAHQGSATYNDVDITDGVTTSTVAYSTYYVKGPVTDGYGYGSGTVGLSAPSSVFTSDTININPQLQTAGNCSLLAGFIITDKPVISRDPVGGVFVQGTGFGLTVGAIGLPIADLSVANERCTHSRRHSATYTNSSATAGRCRQLRCRRDQSLRGRHQRGCHRNHRRRPPGPNGDLGRRYRDGRRARWQRDLELFSCPLVEWCQ